MEKKRFFLADSNPQDLTTPRAMEDGPEKETRQEDQENSLFVLDESSDTEQEQRTQIRDGQSIEYGLFESQLISMIGSISSRAMKYLYNKYHESPIYIQSAAQEYLNGINYNDEPCNDESSVVLDRYIDSNNSNKRNYEHEQQDLIKRLQTEHQRTQEEDTKSTWARYIGSLNIQAWATRPTTKPLQYLDKLELRRLIPKKLNVGKTTKEKAKFGDTSIIRIYTVPKNPADSGREVGRIPEDITRILVPLLDLDIAKLYTTVMMDTSKRLSTGDSFYIQIDCFLSHNAFSCKDSDFSNPQNDQDLNSLKRQKKMDTRTRFDFSVETDTEAKLRLRQRSIARLFQRIGIKPIKKSQGSNSNSNNQELGNLDTSDETAIVIDTDNEEDTSNESMVDHDKEVSDQVNLDQLKQIIQVNQESELLNSLPETTRPPKSNFKLDLRRYQRHGLSWMLTREREIATLDELSRDIECEALSTQARTNIYEGNDGFMNPLWDKFKWPKDVSMSNSLRKPNIYDEYFYANMYNGELSLTKPIIRSMVKGGIVADEMGLGKTISTLALINSVPSDLDFEENKNLENPKTYASKTTLIIVPMSLLSQWKKEFDKANNNSNHKCLIYYGDSACTDLSPILCNKSKDIPIVLITTYGTILNEFARISNGRNPNGFLPKIGLFSVKFFRIVIDEGHNIRNRTAKTTKAIYELASNRKWILTGTPVVNRLDDLYSLVKFLELEPWSNFSYWKTFVTLPFEQKKISQTLDVVKSILEPIFIRRTKNMKNSDGKPLVELPPKQIVIEEIKFNEVEEQLYNWFKARASHSFNEGIKSGDLFKKYSQILTHILRLRQVCCHVDLVGSANEMDQELIDPNSESSTLENPDDSSIVKNLLDDFHSEAKFKNKFANNTEVRTSMYSLYEKVNLTDSECSICTQSPIHIGEMALTSCGHAFCLNCTLEHIDFQEKLNQKPLCPNCREEISKYKLFKLRLKETSMKEIRFHTKQEMDDPSQNYKFQLYLYDPTKTSSKIQALINHLRILKEQKQKEQVVVFSQFSSYLDIIENELKIQMGKEFAIYKFDGRLNMNERQKILETFSSKKQSDDKIRILLLSLKAGGVGLNLTAASIAFMMDPWWSPSVEDQAIDRIHRIGQNQNVKVIRFIIADSIETKMLKIQERKKQIGEAVGIEEEEKRRRRIEEMKILFEE